ncbi:hypothetical protein PZA11_002467 [Diplocarpon coronariae]
MSPVAPDAIAYEAAPNRRFWEPVPPRQRITLRLGVGVLVDRGRGETGVDDPPQVLPSTPATLPGNRELHSFLARSGFHHILPSPPPPLPTLARRDEGSRVLRIQVGRWSAPHGDRDIGWGRAFNPLRELGQAAVIGDETTAREVPAVAVRGAAMDYAACNVLYVDRTAREDKLVRRGDATSTASPPGRLNHAGGHAPVVLPSAVDANLHTLLDTFSEVHVCTSGKACIARLSGLNQSSMAELIPTLVLIDIPPEDQLAERPARQTRTPSPSSQQPIDDGLSGDHADQEEAYGLNLLRWIASEIQYQSLSRLVVPVAVVSTPEQDAAATSQRRPNARAEGQVSYTSSPARKRGGLVTPLDQTPTLKSLDSGAVDVLTSPLLRERLPSLAIHAYRAHKDALKEQRALLEIKRGRKRSWVGVDDERPFAYLREAMVSGLMDGICTLGGEREPLAHVRISIALSRRDLIAAAVGSWHFSAHDFTDDELLHAALLMLQHALAMPELERWRISTESLTGFLVASRSAYNAFVPYHNFRHVVDVLQACFHFLVRLGRLPPYPASSHALAPPPSPIAALIRPFDALALLITAIGHDVGHPGVNNAFLVTLNAPLAQLYNDRSVLESFHCAAYSQILRRHWPAAFQGAEMRQLMISSILATDMGLHFDYMKKLGFLQERLHENGGTDGWNGRLLAEQRTLACSLLIKCADISNVARTYDVAAQWTMILTDEFARQASMENDLGIPSALFAAPVREIIALGKSQIGFMNMFAIPLFQGVTDVMPEMGFCVEELQRNKTGWERKIAEEQERCRKDSLDWATKDGMFSPRTLSVAHSSDASHQKPGNGTLSSEGNLRKALLSQRSLSFPRGASEAAEPCRSSPPGISTAAPAAVAEEASAHPAPGEVGPDLTSRRSFNPSQLQLSLATAGAPGCPGHPSPEPAPALSGEAPPGNTTPTPPLGTDPVSGEPPPTSHEPDGPEPEKQRSSDGTEGSSSAAGDWASQATSATTGQMPLSPSTQGTSIMSHSGSLDKGPASQILTPTGTPVRCGRRSSRTSTMQDSDGEGHGNKSPGPVAEKEKAAKLKKKPSRFRVNFWKRSKSASPPMPVGGARFGREDGMGP